MLFGNISFDLMAVLMPRLFWLSESCQSKTWAKQTWSSRPDGFIRCEHISGVTGRNSSGNRYHSNGGGVIRDYLMCIIKKNRRLKKVFSVNFMSLHGRVAVLLRCQVWNFTDSSGFELAHSRSEYDRANRCPLSRKRRGLVMKRLIGFDFECDRRRVCPLSFKIPLQENKIDLPVSKDTKACWI